MKLLLVEDHLLVAQAMGLYLTEAGHEIVGIAADAHEAVELAGNMLPDLALVDVQLACGTSGIDAAREMLARHNVRSLFVTSDYDAARAAKDAAVGCVRKPYSAPKEAGKRFHGSTLPGALASRLPGGFGASVTL